MGRKGNAAKVEGMAHMPESSNPSSERKSQPKMQTNSAGLSSSRTKVSKNQSAIVRRSHRIQNIAPPTQNADIEPITEQINLSESEKEDDPPAEKKSPEPILGERSLEEKLGYLVQSLEAQEKTIEALKSKATKRTFLSESPCVADIKYKSLYLDSQKKIEALTDENYQLGKKLENALAKLEAYEKGTHVFSEMMEKLKDVILISNLTKATEMALNLSSQAILGGVSSPDAVVEPRTSAKRKRSTASGRRDRLGLAKGSKKN